MQWVEFSGDLERDFTELRRKRSDALLVATGTRGYRRAGEMTALASRHRLPGMFYGSEFVAAGGLMSYFPNMPDLYRRAASHVHRILRGANPGDLPIERPVLIDLEINLATARTLGLKVPQTLLLRAVRVIE
jgi:putative ABC transport system substrate-binding protein